MSILDDLRSRYRRLLHSMQAGVALKIQQGSAEASPKHLRVGVNATLSDTAAIADLLIAKGIFTEQEYLEAIVKRMGDEVTRYESELAATYGANVKLGSLGESIYGGAGSETAADGTGSEGDFWQPG